MLYTLIGNSSTPFAICQCAWFPWKLHNRTSSSQVASHSRAAAATAAAANSSMDSLTELAAVGGENLPAKYIHPNGINGGKDPFLLPFIDIPVIDVGHFTNPSTDTGKELEKLRAALSSYGCLLIINHGVESLLLDKVRTVFKQFLALPTEQKLECWTEGFQGYGSDPLVTDVMVHDWSHRLRLITCPEEMRQMKYWPENPKNFKEVLHEYSTKLQVLHDVMLKAMAKSLKLDESVFLRMIGEPVIMSARFNFYPPCPRPDQVLGLKPHSDGTVITFLLQDKEVEGLQVLKDGQWFRVPVIPDALVLNAGEHLEIMSNGEFKSPIHRAVVNSERKRISLAAPSIPHDGNEIEPVEGLVSEERPRLFRKVKYNGRIHLRYYQSGRRMVDDARI
ncbi:unnamed protein product [Linum trigynum]|uniref:Fe2OG dioxygenase domain-containing protein n=2 Tax=Linum trigynum TaxID=586398 RepID=A0AAV2GYA5_9ROSI